MTYCLGLRLNDGLVLASDSRTSASVDDISVYSKMHVFETKKDRLVVLLSAGNLATTQAVRNQINRDLANPDAKRTLNTLAHLDEIAAYVAKSIARYSKAWRRRRTRLPVSIRRRLSSWAARSAMRLTTFS